MNDLTNYYKLRPEMRSCDLLSWSSSALIPGKIIQWKTGSKINHTSILMRFEKYGVDRVLQAEAIKHGFHPTVLSYTLERYKGHVYWLRLNDEYRDRQGNMFRWIFKKLAIPYDYDSLFKQLFAPVSDDMKKLFCSEAAFMMGKLGGKIDKLQKRSIAPNPGEMDKLGVWTMGGQLI